MTTTSPPHAEYVYGDTAVGGVSNRNNVIPLADFRPEGDDCFRTVFRFTEALKVYADAYKERIDPKTQRPYTHPSVARYPGPCKPGGVHLDFDAPDLALSLEEALRVGHRLVYELGIDARAIHIHYTGGKGFHLFIPESLVGEMEPSEHAHRRVKRLVLALLDGLQITTFDEGNYDKTRLWREENTRNSKGGGYKIPLTFAELSDLTPGAIKALAATPRLDFPRIPDDEWLVNPELAALWRATDTPEPQASHRPPPTPRDAADAERRTVAAAALAAVWPEAGKRHRAALALDGGLIGNGWSQDDADAFVLDVTARAMGADAAARDAEWRRGGATTSARVAQGDPIIGWPTLAALVGDVAVYVAMQLFGMVDAEPILEPDGAAAACARCPDLEAVIETQKAALAATEPLRQEVKDLREEQSLVAAVHRNTAIKTERATAIATLNRVAGDVSRGQTDDRGRVRVPLAAIAENAGCSTKRVSAHLERLQALGVGIIKETEGEWRDVVDPATGVIRHLPTQATFITITQPKIEILRTLATVTAPATEDEATGWGGRRRPVCPDHPDAGVVRLAHCAACRRLLSDEDEAESLCGQDDRVGHETAGEEPPLYQRGQDDRIGADSEPRRPTRDVPDGLRECEICWKLGRRRICASHDGPIDEPPDPAEPVPPDAIDVLLLAHEARYPELPIRQGLRIDAGREAWTAWLAAAEPGQLHHVRVLLREMKRGAS